MILTTRILGEKEAKRSHYHCRGVMTIFSLLLRVLFYNYYHYIISVIIIL